jgi:hypothetical protein
MLDAQAFTDVVRRCALCQSEEEAKRVFERYCMIIADDDETDALLEKTIWQ